MTYTTKVKEELAKKTLNINELTTELSGFIRYSKDIKKSIIISVENASVARLIYSSIKQIFGIKPIITIRNQKRFRIKQIYILEIKEKVDYILKYLCIKENNKMILPSPYFLTTKEEKIAYLEGVFLATGTVNDPATSGYHFEIVVDKYKEALYITNLFKELDIISKPLKRNNKYMIYIKNAEVISEILRMFGAIQSYFYFEDIRIYRDHKNMVNRLNNCEIANQEKTISTGLKQLEEIKYLKKYDLYNLLDDNTKIVLSYRKKYPEASLSELANIISSQTDYKIGKSGVNHHFIKIRNLIKKHQKKQ